MPKTPSKPSARNPQEDWLPVMLSMTLPRRCTAATELSADLGQAAVSQIIQQHLRRLGVRDVEALGPVYEMVKRTGASQFEIEARLDIVSN
jgi:hypothetical protein